MIYKILFTDKICDRDNSFYHIFFPSLIENKRKNHFCYVNDFVTPESIKRLLNKLIKKQSILLRYFLTINYNFIFIHFTYSYVIYKSIKLFFKEYSRFNGKIIIINEVVDDNLLDYVLKFLSYKHNLKYEKKNIWNSRRRKSN